MNYSILSLARAALSGHRSWTPAWRDVAPQSRYDVVVIGGGGHGLATAYFLAREFGIRRVAVLEKGWIGSGNAGRNTTIIRSNYMLPGNTGFTSCRSSCGSGWSRTSVSTLWCHSAGS